MLMRERRRKGAFCLVAALEGPARAASASTAAADDRGAISGKRGETANGKGGDVVVDKAAEELSDDHVLGTLECSRHEFDGTPLAVDVEDGGSKISRWDDIQAGRHPLCLLAFFVGMVPFFNPLYGASKARENQSLKSDFGAP